MALDAAIADERSMSVMTRIPSARGTLVHRLLDSTWLPVNPAYTVSTSTPASSLADAMDFTTADVTASESTTNPLLIPSHCTTLIPVTSTR